MRIYILNPEVVQVELEEGQDSISLSIRERGDVGVKHTLSLTFSDEHGALRLLSGLGGVTQRIHKGLEERAQARRKVDLEAGRAKEAV